MNENPFAPIPATLVLLILAILLAMWMISLICHWFRIGPEYDHEEGEGE